MKWTDFSKKKNHKLQRLTQNKINVSRPIIMKKIETGHWGLMPVMLAIWEAEIGRVKIQG
jgi:hypothetical protein